MVTVKAAVVVAAVRRHFDLGVPVAGLAPERGARNRATLRAGPRRRTRRCAGPAQDWP